LLSPTGDSVVVETGNYHGRGQFCFWDLPSKQLTQFVNRYDFDTESYGEFAFLVGDCVVQIGTTEEENDVIYVWNPTNPSNGQTYIQQGGRDLDVVEYKGVLYYDLPHIHSFDVRTGTFQLETFTTVEASYADYFTTEDYFILKVTRCGLLVAFIGGQLRSGFLSRQKRSKSISEVHVFDLEASPPTHRIFKDEKYRDCWDLKEMPHVNDTQRMLFYHRGHDKKPEILDLNDGSLLHNPYPVPSVHHCIVPASNKHFIHYGDRRNAVLYSTETGEKERVLDFGGLNVDYGQCVVAAARQEIIIDLESPEGSTLAVYCLEEPS